MSHTTGPGGDKSGLDLPEDHHGGKGLPEKLDTGLGMEGATEEITGHRPAFLAAAFEKKPIRFKYKLPVPETLPKEIWINPPFTKNVGV